MNFESRDVVITGGTGGLGQAVVGALLEAGATCHVPYIAERDLQHFPHRDHPKVRLARDVDLVREDVVASFYKQCRTSGPRSISPAVSRHCRSPTPSERSDASG